MRLIVILEDEAGFKIASAKKRIISFDSQGKIGRETISVSRPSSLFRAVSQARITY
ncbi:hypothetical protein SN13T_1622 [Lactiplantibacillus plantarum]|nr:hypothetical protein SN13T_1622 [Lactiplantibacillus plantarum]